MAKQIFTTTFYDFLKKYHSLKFIFRKEIYTLFNPYHRTSSPLFIIGSGRSGTTMLARIFGRSLNTRVYSESHPDAFEHFRIKEIKTIDKLIDKCRNKVIVFKPLQDSHRILELLDGFKNSRAIWIYRDFDDVVNSTVLKWAAWKKGIDDLNLLLARKGRWGEKITSETYTFFQSNYHSNTSIEDAVCLTWYLRNIQYIEMNLSFDPRIMLINYEKLVQSPSITFNKIFDFAGCELRNSYFKDVYSTSIGKTEHPQISEPIRVRSEWLFKQLDNLAPN